MVSLLPWRWIIPLFIVSFLSLYLYFTFRDPIELPNHKIHNHNRLLSSVVSTISENSINDIDKIKLGFNLFIDTNLSSNGKISCDSCHQLLSNGAEAIPISIGVNGKGTRNSPTIFNIDLNTRFFWDGRAASLEEQIEGPIHNPLEMDNSWPSIIEYLNSDTKYQLLFEKTYDGDISDITIKDALVHFMKTLRTPNAPFDLYLKGDNKAISKVAVNGWNKFQNLGCVYCHQGQNIGGNLFQKLGNLTELENSFGENADLGRFNITGDINDRHVFRVPSLRNVAITPPYFHHGKVQTLEEAITIMAKVQLGQDLSPMTIVEISAFLNTLTAPKPTILEELMQ
ncbi:cytochrome B6 [Aliivibrio fischeri]|nr:cytochrome B6 [Aliivibrio fischeri]MUK75737.1 cytochrome B6 [Aliivibrio fischeri]MUL21592.1 cytochrome B6 [Aliivibrio fischeri]MUL23400.1 cytochrome B6 [Aliivibrio fischeri]